MARVTINFPITVEADIESMSGGDESALNLNHTDFVVLRNITVPSGLVIPAGAVSVVDPTPQG